MSSKKKNNTKKKVAKDSEKLSQNRRIASIAYVFMGLLLLAIIHLGMFMSKDQTELMSNPYNKRQDLLAEKVQRGEILAAGGEVLAETKVNKLGQEVRCYPYDELFSHAVGHLDNGKTGIELAENVNLLTTSINPLTQFVNELKDEKSPGNTVVTSLQVKLQKIASQSLGSRKGAVVALDPSTGAILAMVSKPDYDPNTIKTQWDALRNNENAVLLNRATQGLYPPGSTFKILTALEYLREHSDAEDFSYVCKGTATFGGARVNCYNNKKHGNLTLTSAFAKSCNDAFAELGTRLDIKRFRELCESMYFNKNVDLDFESKKSSFELAEGDDLANVTQTVIGQGKTMLTPLQNAMIVSAIANDGEMMRPYLVRQIQSKNKDVIRTIPTQSLGTVMTQEESKRIREMMREVVKSGTASSLNRSSYRSEGKTGSAEFDSSDASHAWYVGIGEKNEKKIVVSVIVEAAGTGGEYAAPIAGKLMDAYFEG